MRVKIRNTLKRWDFDQIMDLFTRKKLDSIEIFSCQLNLDFLDVEPLQVSIEKDGYAVNARFQFHEPIAQEMFYRLKIDETMKRFFIVTIKSIKISIHRQTIDLKTLESDVGFSLRTFERVINSTCDYYDYWLEKEYIVNSDSLDKQVNLRLKEKEHQNMGETPKPFAIIHASNLKEARQIVGDLDVVPLYKGYDKYYPFEGKKEYWMLPRNFVVKLLNCTGNNLWVENMFDTAEKEILKYLFAKRWIKRQVVYGKVHYYGLDEQTERYLKSALKQR
jgi:hypothetical protein